jgi:RNA polymerase sigma-70 factor (ECF subfamily)
VWDVSDEALVAGVAAGDPDVAAVLVHRFQRRVYALALAFTREPVIAEDVAQETFVRAWRYAGSFDAERGTAAAWLLGIARNVALDHTRTIGRRLDHPSADVDRLLADVIGVDDLVSPRDDLVPILDELRALPAEQRETLMAAAYFGFTAREISVAWGVPIGTVKTRLRSALGRLRDVLAGVPA